MHITVVGGGSWGTALANVAASKGDTVCMLVRSASQATNINEKHRNLTYLPDAQLHEAVTATLDPATAFAESALCIWSVPCQATRTALHDVADYLPAGLPFVNTSKGIELGSLLTMSQLVLQVAPAIEQSYASLSGPSFAAEVVRGLPTTVVLACADHTLGAALREQLSNERFRVYSCLDLQGVELGGSIKNVLAIACGLCDGLGFGHNSRAGLITRGLAEMQRLGVALGAEASTFSGLSGLGDLVLTCTGNLSRNRQVGLALAQGKQLEAIMADLGMVAEGVKTTEAVYSLAQQKRIEMPITQTVYEILNGASPRKAAHALMTRSLKEE